MTRCKKYMDKIKGLMAIKDSDERKKAIEEFCNKSPDMIRKITDHIDYSEKYLNNTIVLPEGSTRQLRKMERKEPELHAEVLELVCEGVEPKEAIKQVKTAHVKPVVIPDNMVCDSIENIDKYLDPESVDLILTDPPYPKEYLDLWRILGEKAKIILKRNGFLVAYSGQFYLPEVLNMLCKSLEYVWTFAVTFNGGAQNRVFARNIWNGWKPILVFAKPPYEMEWQTDILYSPARQKDAHEWQQSIGPILTLIEKFTLKNQLVVDPFLGSGTTAKAAEQLGRRFFGMDNDKEVFRR